MLNLARAVRRSLSERGIRGTLARVPGGVRHLIRTVTAIPGEREYARNEKEDGFDAQHGTETSRRVQLFELALSSPNAGEAVHYWPAHVRQIRATFDALHVDASQRVFIDIGAGKGRVLLVASELPFQKLYGVEFSPELFEDAQRNVARYDGGTQQHRIELVCADATEWDFPPQPSVFFLYHPFGAPVMTRFIDRLLQSHAASPREISVIYLNHQHLDLWERTGRFIIERHLNGKPERHFSVLTLR